MEPIKQPAFKVLPDLMQGILATSVAMVGATSNKLLENLGVNQAPVPKSLSQSDLWKIQDDFYSQKGISAWDESVPFLITNSAYIADSYADLIVSFLKDYAPRLDFNEPLYIVELSAGTGRFSFNLLRELSRKLHHYPAFHHLCIKYVMTDITDSHLEFWEQHERLQPYIEADILDFAVYRPEESSSIHLKRAGVTLSPSDFKNPMIGIANYLFDTIRHDLFRVEEGQLMEGLVTITVEKQPEEGQPVDINEVSLSLEYQPVTNWRYYADDKINAVLEHYRTSLSDQNFIIPVGGFRCMDNLREISNGNMMLILSDKGYSTCEDMLIFENHHFAAHGSFSYPVNFDAITCYYQSQGKPAFYTQGCSASLHTTCYIDLAQEDGLSFENVSHVFGEKLARTKPSNSLLSVHTLATMYAPEETTHSDVGMFLGILEASYCEPQIFCKVAPVLMESLVHADVAQVKDLLAIMSTTWEYYYFFRGECQLPFWLSQVYDRLGYGGESIYFLQESIRLFGENESLYYLLGDCQERLNLLDEARQSYIEALTIQPDFPDAQMRLEQLAS